MNTPQTNWNFHGLCWATFFGRWILGLMFMMAGWYKVFSMGADTHAAQLFVEGYKDTWIPVWLLYGTGFVIPFIELTGGAFLILGLRVRTVLVAFGILLVIVTYGHLLKEPIFDITSHIFPRTVFLIFLLVVPREEDRWSVDYLLGNRQTGNT